MLHTTFILSALSTLALGTVLPSHYRRDPDLSSAPSVTNPVTLYRAVSNTEDLKSTRDRIGQSPIVTGVFQKGDFNAVGTPAVYFFSAAENAQTWCNFRVGFSDDISECAVATYEWTPPANLDVKRWNKADNEWLSFITHNWEDASADAIQLQNQWIEGPLVEKTAEGVFVFDPP
ncbi:hypothetical protein C8R43DRAFT_1124874 [Mycena crocata]|nr:hypothetical protein C8R43DRAFT_1124869 [Mycena crocata]KAJ7158263.1 hypothetical protein C8R43DRAFT_1124874 [Mycena crocata]